MILNERSNHREWKNRFRMSSLIFRGRLIEPPCKCGFVLYNFILAYYICSVMKALDIAQF